MSYEEILETAVKNVVKSVLTTVSKEFNKKEFSQIIESVQQSTNKLALQLIEMVIGIVEREYDSNRDRHAIILKNKKPRKILSNAGELEFVRNLYYDKNAERYFFAVDEILKIEKYSRLDNNLKRKLASDATITSYGKSAKLFSNCVSRQTVHNIVKRIPGEQLEVKTKELRRVDKIYIEGDEDHIHLNNGKSAEVKLLYVHEGRDKICKNRTGLKNVKYFASAGETDIWEAVENYLYYQYHLHGTQIQISGDGASWIKKGLRYFPTAEYKLDKFHVFKSITDACCGDMRFRKQILNCLMSENKEGIEELYKTRIKETRYTATKYLLMNSLTYLDNNFDAIDLTSNNHCSAEGHISHVLSERMSSRPMAWSKKGADKMARLRAFYFNGGNFNNLNFTSDKPQRPKKEKYNCVMQETKKTHAVPQGRITLPEGVSESIVQAVKSLIDKL